MSTREQLDLHLAEKVERRKTRTARRNDAKIAKRKQGWKK